jgi:hypothetical protein
VIVIGLAAARAARAISVDDVTEPLRARLRQAAARDGEGRLAMRRLERDQVSVR